MPSKRLEGTPSVKDVGSHTITFQLNDGLAVVNRSYSLVVDSNDPPEIVANSQTTEEDVSLIDISFSVSDDQTNVNELNVYARSTDESKLKTTDIIISGSGANRTFSVTPLKNYVGISSFYIYAEDSGKKVGEKLVEITTTPVDDGPLFINDKDFFFPI